MALTPLAPLDRTSPSFKADLDTFFLSSMPQLVSEINSTEAGMSAFAAGGAYAFPYTFDSATADADPGVGKLRLGSATQSASTVLRIDTAIVGGVDIAQVFTDLLAVTSVTKGSIRLVKAGDPTKWMIFDVTGGAGSGFRNLIVSARVFSAASPFANGDALIAYVERGGDKGEIASGACVLLASTSVGAAVANIDFLNLFTAAYDRYVIDVAGVAPSAASFLAMQLAVGGVPSNTNYGSAGGDAIALTLGTHFLLTGTTMTADATARVEIGNVHSATKSRAFSAVGFCFDGSYKTINRAGVFATGGSVTGFRLFWNSGANFTSGTVRVYGIKNS